MTTEPKFVQKKRQQKAEKKENQGMEGIREAVSTPEKENGEKMLLVSTSEKAGS